MSKLQFRSGDHELNDNTAAILPCGHIARYRCLQEWLRRHKNCPFCGLDLKYKLCDQSIPARPVAKKTIHTIPRTIPEGGRIATQCKECRLETYSRCADTLWQSNVRDLEQARE